MQVSTGQQWTALQQSLALLCTRFCCGSRLTWLRLWDEPNETSESSWATMQDILCKEQGHITVASASACRTQAWLLHLSL